MSIFGIYFLNRQLHHIASFLKNFKSFKSIAHNWKYIELCKKGKYFFIYKECR